MITIKSEAALYTSAMLVVLSCAGCKAQPSTSTPPSQPAASAPNQTTPPGTATPASDANASGKGKIDACKLLTADEIQSVQGDALKETKASEQGRGPLTTVQCLYTTSNFVNSVSLTVMQQNAASPGGQTVKEFWKERFGRVEGEKDRQKERDKDRKRGEGEKEESLPAQRVKSVGDEAYWVGNAKIGALYVLKGDTFLRISIGGVHTQQVRTEKIKALAQAAIKRL